MSLQRIFESARKLGVPVIITDPAGRDPLVVVPLEQFEALTGAGEAAQLAPQPTRVPLADRRSEPVSSPSESAATPIGGSSEISLDERFYLEPVDDQG